MKTMGKLTGKSTIDVGKMVQRIDLKEYFGRNPTESEKRNFAEAAIEKINNRTLSGNDLDGNDFQDYSEAYARKKGVSKEAVDLFDKGDMLDSVVRNPFEESKSEVAISINGIKEVKKGYAHQVGDGKMPERQWFGITESEAKDIAKSVREVSNTTTAQLMKAAKELEVKEQTRETITVADLIEELSKLGIKQEF